MQKFVVAPLFLATLALAACGTSNTPGNSASASATPSASDGSTPAPAATAVTGTVKLQDATTQISPEATLELALVDVTRQPGVTVNTQAFNPPAFPQAFHIPFSASAINATDL